jgi:uncharacterized membrane protein YfcA
MNLDPASAALYAIIAICLVLVGAILTQGILSIEQRSSVLAAIVAVLGGIAIWSRRMKRKRKPRKPGDSDGPANS